jgi:hypothetical protein
MSLSFDLTKIKNWKETCWMTTEGETESTMNPITDGLIWYTLITGIGEITEKNYVEFYKRMTLHDKVNGTVLLKKGEPRPITLEEVKAHIGLHTNVWPKTTKTAFLNKLMDSIEVKEDKKENITWRKK